VGDGSTDAPGSGLTEASASGSEDPSAAEPAGGLAAPANDHASETMRARRRRRPKRADLVA
jgi:hypothetical protein